MKKRFNVTADCKPDRHYMVDITSKLEKIKDMVDQGEYFTINRARQFGKTTTLRALTRFLRQEYIVISLDFQLVSHEDFRDESEFTAAFARELIDEIIFRSAASSEIISQLESFTYGGESKNSLSQLFRVLSKWCAESAKPIVLMIDEVDAATNNQVFLDFLAQLRGYYIKRDFKPTFHSVILAGVHDIKNLKSKFRSDGEQKTNSPWNIAADFRVDMSFSKDEIAGMLQEYENDHRIGMDIEEVAKQIYAYTSGYPFLVSRVCKTIDEELCEAGSAYPDAWTAAGVNEAVKRILAGRNMLFESLSEKLLRYPVLNTMLRTLLFTGKVLAYNYYEPSINIATMFGFVKNQNGALAVSNRIFETWLYNYYLSSAEFHDEDIYTASLLDKNQFIAGEHLNMRLVLEKFVTHFNDLYGDRGETFIEEEGRKFFLLYLRPIINGVGNYYIESRTRELRRTDIIVDYRSEQYIIEMKIWHGDEYNKRGEQQLADYLDAYHKKTGYMVSFNFNKNKQIGVHEMVIGDKLLIEAVV